MPGAKPKDTKHIVISVPHSGTRTLQTWLAENRPETIPTYMDTPSHWHFNFHPHYISKFFLYADDTGDGRKAYIPIRNPFDVADSWERRYGDATDKSGVDMCQALHMMVRCIVAHSQHIETFRIEELPVLRGAIERPSNWDRQVVAQGARVGYLRRWVRSNAEVESFYRGYYTDVDLWWLD